MDIQDKTVLLTGASGGIGQHTAQQLAAKGACLILTGRNEQSLNAVRSTLKAPKSGVKHQTMVADLNSSSDIDRLRTITHEIDVVINLAGVNQLAMLEQMNDTEIGVIIQSNLVAPIQLCRALLPRLRKRPEAAIINVGSILGSVGIPASSVYCASKFGLRGFTEALRRELCESTVKVFYIAPRATDTAMNGDTANALNRALGNKMDSPEMVASSIVDAIAGDQNSRYLGWPEKLFVRINAVFPTLVDGALKKQLKTIKQHLK